MTTLKIRSLTLAAGPCGTVSGSAGKRRLFDSPLCITQSIALRKNAEQVYEKKQWMEALLGARTRVSNKMKGIFIFCPAGLLHAGEYVSIVPIWGLLKDFFAGGFYHRTRPYGLRQGRCTEISRLPTGSTAIGHRHRQHPAPAAAETAGALPKPQERWVKNCIASRIGFLLLKMNIW